MICKEGSIDVISNSNNSANNSCSQPSSQMDSNSGSTRTIITNGHNTLQHRRKSQLITFSASSCDIKNSLSHEIIMIQQQQQPQQQQNSCSDGGSSIGGGVGCGSGGGRTASGGSSGGRNSIIGSIGSGSHVGTLNGARLSFAEEDIMIIPSHHLNGGGQHQQHYNHQNGSLSGSNGGSSASGCGSSMGGTNNQDMLDDEVFRRRSLEIDEEAQEALFDEEYGTHIETKSNNANDDSGGGSYEDSHALHSSLGSNRNSLEKDDDDIEVDVISTDVSCYDQLLGSSCNTRNDEDDIATLVGDGEHYTKLSKHNAKTTTKHIGGGGGGGVGVTTTFGSTNSGVGGGSLGENGGIIYANPFMDDEGIAESGM